MNSELETALPIPPTPAMPRTGPEEPVLTAVVACSAAGCAFTALPPVWVASWLMSVLMLCGLRLIRPMPPVVWAAAGLSWGLGAAAGGALARDALGAVPVLVAMAAPLLAALGRGWTTRHFLMLLCGAYLPPILNAVSAGRLEALATALPLAVAGSFTLVLARRLRQTDELVETQTSARLQAEYQADVLNQEMLRMKLEARTVGESNDNLSDELTTANQELALLRTKAGALSTVLQRINPYDAETGLLTAEKFATVMSREWARMQRQELPLSVLLVSIDRFEDFRKAHSRVSYEAALRRISDVMRYAGNRPGDVAARIAPGTFGLLFPETDHKHVNRLADTVRARIRQLSVPLDPTTAGGHVTATVGMATVIPNNEMNPITLRERVEAALYEAQFQGGDRSVRYRTMDSIRLERWNPEQEGALTADGIRHKLAVLGYAAEAKTYRPGETQPSRRVPVDRVEAIVEGELRISLDGEARVLKPGDLLFIPKGLVTSIEVVSRKPVVCLEAIRA